MRTTPAVAALLAAGLLVTGCGKSEAEVQTDCAQAIDDTSTVTHRPADCEQLSDDAYKALLTDYALKKSGLVGDDGHVRVGQ